MGKGELELDLLKNLELPSAKLAVSVHVIGKAHTTSPSLYVLIAFFSNPF